MSNHKDANDPYKDLHPDQIQQIKNLDNSITKLLDIAAQFKNFQDFRLGDVYIQEQWSDHNKTPWVNTNHMGFPVKFKVVHISKQGVPFMRQLNSNGKPTGGLVTPPNKTLTFIEQFHMLSNNREFTHRFVPDPEALDAILLETEFEPMAQHKEKLKLFNEISKHNKKVTIKTGWNGGHAVISAYFKTLKPGDKFWTGPSTAYVLQSLVKTGKEWCITAVDQNGATHNFNFAHFWHKRLYSDQPRSFKHESAT